MDEELMQPVDLSNAQGQIQFFQQPVPVEPKFKAGDIVAILSGSVAMTVVSTDSAGTVSVCFFDREKGTFSAGGFPQDILEMSTKSGVPY